MTHQKKPQVLTWPAIGETITIPGAGDFVVQKPCSNAHYGHWYCITHGEHFVSQFQKDIHIHRGAHKLVWCCNEHGLEVSENWV